jgi:hypothetical protein
MEDLVQRANARGIETPYLSLAAAHLAVYNNRVRLEDDDHSIA